VGFSPRREGRYSNKSPAGANAHVFHRPMGTNPLLPIIPYGIRYPTGSDTLLQQIPYGIHSPTGSTPLRQQIPCTNGSPAGANAHVFHRPMGTNPLRLAFPYGFCSLREPTATFSSPVREPMPCGFRSPVPRSTSNSPTPQPTAWALLSQEQASIWAHAPYGNESHSRTGYPQLRFREGGKKADDDL